MTVFSEESPPRVLELWGGVECTINRVGDQWFDQSQRNGHGLREGDLQAFTELGLRRLRQPVLWETAQNARPEGDYDFTRADRELAQLQKLGIDPIVGLLHHGSGPGFTSLVDPEFPEKFVRYARAVACRYPWVRDYTPINEILTTARFSGLYGVWFPHATDSRSFFSALFNQVRATVLAMREIRKIQPHARLIQTDDLGRAQGTDACLAQVEFENHRRWLAFDLLVGAVDEKHPLWQWMLSEGATEAELRWHLENTCKPDIVGINHYLLSNRWLDQRRELYPPSYRGGNGHANYADVGAVQTLHFKIPEPLPRRISPEEILREAAERYRLPIAVTEVHVDGPREAQLQWFNEVWGAAQRLKSEGFPVVAVTAWSLLGSFDWNSLCTANRGYYESGVFDLRAAKPRKTALGTMIKGLITHGRFHHPVLENQGWWRSPKKEHRSMPLILIAGATGTLGQAYARLCEERGLSYKIVSRQEMDLTDLESVRRALDFVKPWLVINAAGYVRVDDAEAERDAAFRANVLGPEILASECRARGLPMIAFSSDLVFDGEARTAPYTEVDFAAPLNVYGQTKAEMEIRVAGLQPESLIVRTSSFFGPWDRHNFVFQALSTLAANREFRAAQDLVISPTYVPSLVNRSLDLVLDGLRGVVHLTNNGQLSWAELAQKSADFFELKEKRVVGVNAGDLEFKAQRPRFSALSSSVVPGLMPTLDEVLDRYKWSLDSQLREEILNEQRKRSTAPEAS